jgi:hypothetical protein
MMDIYVFELSSKAVASGVWSGNTLKIPSGILRQIVLQAPGSGVTFDLKITDDRSHTVYDTALREKTATGFLIDEVQIPVKGVYTIRIYGATSDGAYNGRLLVRDG